MRPSPPLREWLAEAPFGLTMSSGFFAFYAHCGVLAALEEQDLTPIHVSGSSAGALVGGAWAAGVSAETLRDTLFALQRADFWDPSLGPGLLRGDLFIEALSALLPVTDFAQCRARLTVSAFNLRRAKTSLLRSGALAPAIAASCAVPFLFQPVWIDGHPHVDGGLRDRHGLAGMEMDRVFYHHIPSRMPWRKADRQDPKIPHRSGLKTLNIRNLPPVGPFSLQRGRQAFEQSLHATREALSLPATRMIWR